MLIKENIDQKKKLWEKNELEDCVRMLINKIHYFLKYLWYLSAFYLFSFYFTILYWFRHALTWLHHGCTRVPHPEPPSTLPPYTIPLGYPSTPAPSILYPASNLDWRLVSYMILYMFQCHSPKSSHPLLEIELSLLFNMLSRLVITFLPRSKRLLISWQQSPSTVILEPRKIKSATVFPSICHEVMGPDAMILVF